MSPLTRRPLLAMMLFGFLVSLACGTTPNSLSTQSSLPEGWKRHQSNYGYSVGYPSTWTKQEDQALGLASFYDPATGVGFDIGIATTSQRNLKAYVDSNKISPAEGANYLSQGPTIVNGREGYELVLTLPSRFFGSGFRPGTLRHRQIAFLSGGKVYVLTATALEDEYADFVDTFDAVVDSFVIRER